MITDLNPLGVPIVLHWALFDSAYHTPTGSHWTWYSPTLNVDLLDELYYEVLLDEFTGLININPASVIGGGIASVARTWCCWFRIYDGGMDLRGRPGRYIICVAFAQRPLTLPIDSQSIFELPTFELIKSNRNKLPPLPRPESYETLIRPGLPSVAPGIIDGLQSGQVRVVQKAKARAIANYCLQSPSIDQWKCIELANEISSKILLHLPEQPAHRAPNSADNTEERSHPDDGQMNEPQAFTGKSKLLKGATVVLMVILLVVIAIALRQVRERRFRDRSTDGSSAEQAR